MDISTINFGEIIWWALIVAFLAMLWRLVSSVQDLANVLKKFEDFKITELPPAAVPAPVVAAVAAPAPVPAANSDAIPGEIVAVIAAAVDTVMHGPHRILSITPVGGGQSHAQTSMAWSAEGRRQIFQSHKVR